MILKGNARGGAKNLALHLMKEENEHVEVYELRGFVSQNLMGALNEVYAISRGTRCKQFLYSLSLNPPPGEDVKTSEFVEAIEQAESRLGLSGQPRAIVFHEKEGRRHSHVVWSRIRIAEMKAVQMSYDHEKLQLLSRELFLEHGWTMPAGLADRSLRDPRNFTLEEWQQARRAGKDARAIKTALQDAWAIKTALQDAWAISDSKAAFAHALEERGYWIARGDSGRFVAVDFQGEIYSIRQWTGIRTKQIRQRLGDESEYPGVAEVKEKITNVMLARLDGFSRELEAQEQELAAGFEQRRAALVRRQRAERQTLADRVRQRRIAEAVERQGRFRKGLAGIWDFLRGEHARIRERNEQEAEAAAIRDRTEQDTLAFLQLKERRTLEIFRLNVSRDYVKERNEIGQDIEAYRAMRETGHDPPEPKRERRSARRPRRRRGAAPEP